MSVLDQASLVQIPSGYKAGTIFSQVPTDGTGDLTFARSTTATRVNPDGLIETMPPNVMENSEPTSTGAFKTGVTFQATDIFSWNGIYYGDNSARRIAFLAAAAVVGQTYTFSAFVKMADGSIPSVGDLATDDFRMWNGSATTNGLTIEDVGGDIYRCSVVRVATSTANNVAIEKQTYNSSKTFEASGFQQVLGSVPKTYYPTTDLLNYPRLDFTGGGCGKYLFEPQRTNTILSNSDYSNIWSNVGANPITDDAIQSPKDGVLAQKITVANSYGQHYFRQILNGHTVGEDYTFSVFAKAGELDSLTLRLFNGNDTNVIFDLTNGIITSGTNGKIEDYGNGWYRCSSYFVAQSTYLYPYLYILAGNAQGDGTSGMYWWNAQLEEGSYATSAIETESSSVTRTADTSSTSGLSSVIGQTEGTIMVDIDFPYWKSLFGVTFFDIGDSSDYIIAFSNPDKLLLRVAVGGSLQVSYAGSSGQLVSGSRYKIAIAYKENDFAIYLNGVSIHTDTSGTVPAMSVITQSWAGNYLGGIYNEIYLSKTRLTNTELIALTTL